MGGRCGRNACLLPLPFSSARKSSSTILSSPPAIQRHPSFVLSVSVPPSGIRKSKEETKFGRRGRFGPTSVHKPGLLAFSAQYVRISPRRALARLASLCYCANPKFPLCFSQGAASSVNTFITLQASLLCSPHFRRRARLLCETIRCNRG